MQQLKNLKILIEQLKYEAKPLYIDIYDADTRHLYIKRIGIDKILQENQDVLAWFKEIPFNQIEISKLHKNGQTASGKQNYRKVDTIHIDLDNLRQPIQHSQEMHSSPLAKPPVHFNNVTQKNSYQGLQGIQDPNSLRYLLEKESNEFSQFKGNAKEQITSLITELEEKTKEVIDLKDEVKELKTDLRFKEHESKPSVFTSENIEKAINSVPAMFNAFMQIKAPAGMNAPAPGPQKNLSDTQKTFIQLIEDISDDDINVLFSVSSGLKSEHREEIFNTIKAILIEKQIIQ